MNQGYVPKDLHFGTQAQYALVNGITKIARAVKSTLGPRGNTVLIESPEHLSSMTVTKDGVTVAKSVSLIYPVEDLAVRMMKQASEKTALEAGDGTTTAIVLTEAIVNSTIKNEELKGKQFNKTVFIRNMNLLTEKVVAALKKMSKRVTKKMLIDVATISANNDRSIGKIISDVYKDVGTDGIVTVENSKTSETYYETTKGFKVNRGYSSNLFVNNQKRDECIMEDVMVMVSDAEIHNILQIEQILKVIIQENKRLLIIAPCSTNVLNTLAANKVKNGLKVCVIQPPNFGYKQHEEMQDIATSVGATYYSEKTGDDMSLLTYVDLGHASKVVAGQSHTVIVNSDERTNQDEVDELISQLRVQQQEATRKADRDFIGTRIANLAGGVGVIYVGGKTDIEQKELYDRVDDAVCAVRSALEEGVLPGGGKALYHLSNTMPELMSFEEDSLELHWAKRTMALAMQSPLITILDNAGFDFDEIYSEEFFANEGFNVKTSEYGNLYEMGVIDPAKVTRCAFENAVSVATTILSTNAIVTMAREISK